MIRSKTASGVVTRVQNWSFWPKLLSAAFLHNAEPFSTPTYPFLLQCVCQLQSPRLFPPRPSFRPVYVLPSVALDSLPEPDHFRAQTRRCAPQTAPSCLTSSFGCICASVCDSMAPHGVVRPLSPAPFSWVSSLFTSTHVRTVFSPPLRSPHKLRRGFHLQ